MDGVGRYNRQDRTKGIQGDEANCRCKENHPSLPSPPRHARIFQGAHPSDYTAILLTILLHSSVPEKCPLPRQVIPFTTFLPRSLTFSDSRSSLKIVQSFLEDRRETLRLINFVKINRANFSTKCKNKINPTRSNLIIL